MTARFTVLASGSGGNASLLQAGDFGVLIDFGLGSRTLASRMIARGLSWRSAHAVLLTHTHGDHWNPTALAALAKHGLPLYCHAAHAECLARCPAFSAHYGAGLVRCYQPGRWLTLDRGVRVLPLEVSHDGGPTFAFRVEGPAGLYGAEWSLGYAADLGTWCDDFAQAMADVDLLALEFNHEEELQRSSGRPWHLIRRVLSDEGHLSNRQAADLLLAVRRHSRYAGPRTVVPLHLSRECNTQDLALAAAVPAAGERANVVPALQHVPTDTLPLSRVPGRTVTRVPRLRRNAAGHPTFFDA
jgi:phosphoribosyl 1,2-cyclic phosphodiesterase